MKCSAIILLAGNSSRFNAEESKQFYLINNKPLIFYTISCFEKSDLVDEIILVAKKDNFELIQNIVKQANFKKVSHVVEGGSTRKLSVESGLKVVNEDLDSIVLIHDGARPIVPSTIISELISAAQKYGAAIPVIDEENSVVELENDNVSKYVDRKSIHLVQTPQAFKIGLIKKAHSLVENINATDDAQLVSNLGTDVKTIKGSKKMLKVTTIDDAFYIESILGGAK